MSEATESFSEERRRGLSAESKVGLFVLAGLSVLVISILMLGDVHFKPIREYRLIFKNVEGISDKSPVKISGVDVGNVRSIKLLDHHAELIIAIAKEIKVYKNASARLRSTGIIGTKFIALNAGSPAAGQPEEGQLLKNGDTIMGEDVLGFDELLERVAKSMDEITGGGKLGMNLNATMENLHSITDSLNAAVGKQRVSMVNIVKNIEDFSAHAKSVGAHLDDILENSKQDMKSAIHQLKETLEKMNDILGKVQRGEGAIGALVNDKQTGDDLKQTVSNLKSTSEAAKEVLSRFTKVRVYWELGARQDFKASVTRADVGVRLEPRPNKFYSVVGQNLINAKTSHNSAVDYERQNTVTALMGRHWGPFTGAIGFVKSRGGLELRYRPFQDTEMPVLNRVEFMAQGSDFGREDTIKGRAFSKPIYTAGARYKLNSYLSAGIQAEDIAEVSDLTGTFNVAFEDRDVAYLLGFASFAK